ncbi:PepSY-associated TM helix domain-containing protein [Haloferula chungangensis]|uniref:PepSY-associated TM helix domain-containing protein n=1 Tax=Haloferula chungangensis TaxID=1048331 RepID=A0ABW2L9A8_9BACT
MPDPETSTQRSKSKKRKAFWTKQFYAWHWISSALSLVGILLFAVTGITLNHAADIPAKPAISTRELTLPTEIAQDLAAQPDESDRDAPLPEPVARWLGKELRTPLIGKIAEWTEYEIYLSLPRPGGDAWLAIDRESAEVSYELTTRGAISYLNDLHKGRHTGPVWAWFIDIFSVATVVFSLTGLALLWVHARRRPQTWPIVAAGFVIPLILILFFIH